MPAPSPPSRLGVSPSASESWFPSGSPRPSTTAMVARPGAILAEHLRESAAQWAMCLTVVALPAGVEDQLCKVPAAHAT